MEAGREAGRKADRNGVHWAQTCNTTIDPYVPYCLNISLTHLRNTLVKAPTPLAAKAYSSGMNRRARAQSSGAWGQPQHTRQALIPPPRLSTALALALGMDRGRRRRGEGVVVP